MNQVNVESKTQTEKALASSAGELNLRIFQSLARYLRDKHGIKAFGRIAKAAGLSLRQFDGKSHWALHSQVEIFLAQAFELIGSEPAFMEACAYQMKESLGPLSFVFRALRPRKVYELGVRDHHLFSKISSNEILDISDNHITIRLTNTKKESRLLCLSRLGTMVKLPCLCGLPQATIRESGCISKGDDACVYHLKWYEAKRWLPVLFGAVTGGAVAAGMVFFGQNSVPLWLVLPLFGGLIGYCSELIRTGRVNLRISEEMKEALIEIAENDAEARNEMFELNRRQMEWTRMIEEQFAERSERFEKMLDKMRNFQDSRHSVLLGFSHDLRNPLNILRMSSTYLKDNLKDLEKDSMEVLDCQERAVDDMELLLGELMAMSKSDLALVKTNPETIKIRNLADQLRKRLKALVFGRDIRTSVFSNREAPEIIETDILIFNRVTDNLLTNAAKYTERGSIVIQLNGRPGFLTIRISDTGRGIARESIKKIFERSGSDKSTRARFSHGVGLSVVVQLMAQIGGTIEVMSKPGKGSTFWIHLPVSLSKNKAQGATENKQSIVPLEQLVSQVVTVRESN